MGVERHGDAELRVRRAVAPEILVGVLVERGAPALELGGDLGRAHDRRHRRDLLSLRADDATHTVCGKELPHRRHGVSLVALRIRMAQVQLLAQHSARIVDDLLRDLRSLEHRLPEHRKRARETGEHAERHMPGAVGLDVAPTRAAGWTRTAARSDDNGHRDTGEQAFRSTCLRDPGHGCRRHCPTSVIGPFVGPSPITGGSLLRRGRLCQWVGG